MDLQVCLTFIELKPSSYPPRVRESEDFGHRLSVGATDSGTPELIYGDW